MASLKEQRLHLLKSDLQDTLSSLEQHILGLVERSLDRVKSRREQQFLSPTSDGKEPEAPHSTQEREFVLRPSGDHIRSLVKIKEEPVDDFNQGNKMVLHEESLTQEREFVLRPSEDNNRSLVKIKEEPVDDLIQGNKMVLHEESLNTENDGCQLPTIATSLSDRSKSGEANDRKERSYLCDICGKSFHTKYYLKIHIRFHTGERPFPCDICGRSFFLKVNLRDHKLIHKREKPFQCKVCKMLFRTKSATNIHQLRYGHRKTSKRTQGAHEEDTESP